MLQGSWYIHQYFKNWQYACKCYRDDGLGITTVSTDVGGIPFFLEHGKIHCL